MRKFLAVLFFFGVLSVISSISVFGQTGGGKYPADNFSVTTIEGKTYKAADLRGKIVVFNLWFVGCPNCLEEIGLLNKLVGDYQNNQDIIFLGLATNNPNQLKSFLKKNPFKYQIVPNATNLMLTQFAAPDKNGQTNIPFPMHIVIDREGKKTVGISGVKGVEAVRKELEKQTAAKISGGKKTN